MYITKIHILHSIKAVYKLKYAYISEIFQKLDINYNIQFLTYLIEIPVDSETFDCFKILNCRTDWLNQNSQACNLQTM